MRELAKHVSLLNGFPPNGINVYLVGDVLVDAATRWAEQRNLRELGDRKLSPETLMMGYGYSPSLSEGALKPPLFQTSTFVFENAEEGKASFELAYGLREKNRGEEQHLIYSRINNPNSTDRSPPNTDASAKQRLSSFV